MSRGTITLGFEQRSTLAGAANLVELAITGADGPTTRLAAEYVHLGVTELAEPAVLDGYIFGWLMMALEHAERLVVKGPVSTRALRNAHIIGEAWRSWMPDRYAPVEIVAERELDDGQLAGRTGERALAAFSGGVDSVFLAIRQAGDSLGNAGYPLDTVVMVHGFDVPAEDAAAFHVLVTKTGPLLDRLRLQLRCVRTNCRVVGPPGVRQDWEHSFGAQLAGVLHQFSAEFAHGLIGSSKPYNHPITAWGSTPQTDYLLSGGGFEIVHDGAGYSRTEKVERIAQDGDATATLQVCWEGTDRARNCGVCEKCVRTRLNFAAVGMTDPKCFDTPLRADMVDALRIRNTAQLLEARTIVEYAEQHGVDGESLDRLRRRIPVFERELNGPPASERPGRPLRSRLRLR